jgi:hypothetical protein
LCGASSPGPAICTDLLYGSVNTLARVHTSSKAHVRQQRYSSVGANGGLDFRFVDIEVGVDVLNVIVLFESFDEPQHRGGPLAGDHSRKE